jgi:hypothetical protein
MTTFDTYNAAMGKTPMYKVAVTCTISGTPTTLKFFNHLPSDVAPTTKCYLFGLSGGSRSVTPRTASSTISELNMQVGDLGGDITGYIANATGRLQNAPVMLSIGFQGMAENDMVPFYSGTVINYSYNEGIYKFAVADLMKGVNTDCCKSATEDDPVTMLGNPINLILQILTSTEAGTNGAYDLLGSNGLGIPVANISLSDIETLRNRWFPIGGDEFSLSISEPINALELLETHFFQPLNLYLDINGDRKLSLQIVKPPLPPISTLRITDDDMLEPPTVDANLGELINSIMVKFNYGDAVAGEFEYASYYVDVDSTQDRGPCDETLELSSEAIHTAYMDVTSFINKYISRMFIRYAVPPLKMNVRLHMTHALISCGDVVFVSSKTIPNFNTGLFDFTNIPMEATNVSLDYKKGIVSVDLIYSGFGYGPFCSLSPTMTVVTGVSTTEFTTSTADAAKYEEGWSATISNSVGKERDTNKLISDITGDTITIATLSVTPSTGDIVNFPDYPNNTEATQKLYGHISCATAVTGTVTSDSGAVLTDSALSMTPDAYIGATLLIDSGALRGFSEEIVDNSATTVTITTEIATAIEVGDKFSIIPAAIVGTDYVIIP